MFSRHPQSAGSIQCPAGDVAHGHGTGHRNFLSNLPQQGMISLKNSMFCTLFEKAKSLIPKLHGALFCIKQFAAL